MKAYNRRDFIKLSALYSVSASGILIPINQANAFLPILARILLGGMFRAGVTRGAVAAGARMISGSYLRSLASTGLAVASVSSNIYELMQEHDAKTIWVNQGVTNIFHVTGQGENDSEVINTNFYYNFKDAVSNSVQKELYAGMLVVPPRKSFKFSFEINELPFTGVYKISGRTDSSRVNIIESDNFILASRDDVILNRSSQGEAEL